MLGSVAALGVVLSLFAGVAAWWGARHWLIATITFGGTLQENPDAIVNRAAAGVAICVITSLWALIAAISSLRERVSGEHRSFRMSRDT